MEKRKEIKKQYIINLNVINQDDAQKAIEEYLEATGKINNKNCEIEYDLDIINNEVIYTAKVKCFDKNEDIIYQFKVVGE